MSPAHYEQLVELVIQPLKDQGAQVFLFGSRSTGRNHPNSDVDLLYRGDVPLEIISKIKEDIEDSLFPFAVDLVNEADLVESYRQSVSAQLISL
jgi:predicted nucleotidyltransferase